MAIKIRLTRAGAKKRPYYRIVVADSRSPRDGRFIEKVGTYNPMLPSDSEDRVRLFEDRIKHWLATGAEPTERVERFLAKAGLVKAKTFSNPEKALPRKKAQERMKAEAAAAEAAAEKEAAAKAAAKAEAEAAKAAAAAPAAEAAVEA